MMSREDFCLHVNGSTAVLSDFLKFFLFSHIICKLTKLILICLPGDKEKGRGKTVILATGVCSVPKLGSSFYCVHQKSIHMSWHSESDIDFLEVMIFLSTIT